MSTAIILYLKIKFKKSIVTTLTGIKNNWNLKNNKKNIAHANTQVHKEIRKYGRKKTSKIAKYKWSPGREETEHWNDMEIFGSSPKIFQIKVKLF